MRKDAVGQRALVEGCASRGSCASPVALLQALFATCTRLKRQSGCANAYQGLEVSSRSEGRACHRWSCSKRSWRRPAHDADSAQSAYAGPAGLRHVCKCTIQVRPMRPVECYVPSTCGHSNAAEPQRTTAHFRCPHLVTSMAEQVGMHHRLLRQMLKPPCGLCITCATEAAAPETPPTPPAAPSPPWPRWLTSVVWPDILARS